MADVINGVVQVDYANCADGPLPGVPLPPVEGPPGGPGPPGPAGPANTKFNFVFNIGDGLNEIALGSKVAIPSAFAGNIDRWRARVAGDLVASVGFTIKTAPSVTGALATVGGTMPAIVANKGAQVLGPLDWIKTSIVVGEVMEAEVISGDCRGVTLVVECSII